MQRRAPRAVVVLSFWAGSTWGAIQYTILDLGTLGGPGSRAYGINNSGQVVGYADTSSGFQHAFRTAPNQPINSSTDDLGTLGGTTSCARAINDSGQVVGFAYTSSGAQHAFRTAANQPINVATDDLGTMGGTYSDARDINNAGQVVGIANWKLFPSSPSFLVGAFRTARNHAINPSTDNLGMLYSGGVISQALAINDSGQVVGWSSDTNHSAAFRTTANQPINPTTDNLGEYGTAYDINSSGQVVGIQQRSDGWHAFRNTNSDTRGRRSRRTKPQTSGQSQQ